MFDARLHALVGVQFSDKYDDLFSFSFATLLGCDPFSADRIIRFLGFRLEGFSSRFDGQVKPHGFGACQGVYGLPLSRVPVNVDQD